MRNFSENQFVKKRGKSERTEISDKGNSIEEEKFALESPGENILENREKTGIKSLKGGSNEVFFVELRDGGSGIFKPKSGEQEGLRFTVREGTYYLRERASYLIDKFLGFGLVPPTVIREIDGETGSLQQFVPDAKMGEEIPDKEYEESDSLRAGLMKLMIFDYIIYNTDRNDGNFLVKNGNIYAIDNSLSFGKEVMKYFMYHRDFFNVSFPDEIRMSMEAFLAQKERQEQLKESLADLLSPDEIAACLARIGKIGGLLSKYGMLPEDEKSNLTFDASV